MYTWLESLSQNEWLVFMQVLGSFGGGPAGRDLWFGGVYTEG